MRKIIQLLFTISLILFMVGGTLLVLGQIMGIILMNGELMVQVTNIFSEPTFITASISGLLGFVYSYFPKEKQQ